MCWPRQTRQDRGRWWSPGFRIPAGCDITICDPGFYCEAGACLDECAGAVWPRGLECQGGNCVDVTPTMPDGGPRPTWDAGPGVDGGGGGDIDGGGDGEVDAGRRPPRASGGCGCSVPERSSGGGPLPAWALALAALGLFLGWRRRR